MLLQLLLLLQLLQLLQLLWLLLLLLLQDRFKVRFEGKLETSQINKILTFKSFFLVFGANAVGVVALATAVVVAANVAVVVVGTAALISYRSHSLATAAGVELEQV